MKKHFLTTVLAISGLILLSSCLKDDPKENEVVYYAYQHIPNINEFMPQRLLQAFGDQNLYYGDEPPKIEGNFKADDLELYLKSITDSSHYMIELGPLAYTAYFEISEQHKGIAKCTFKAPHGNYEHPEYGGYFCEYSSCDTTYAIIKDNMGHFVDDTIAPYWFTDRDYTKDNFNTIYIMGSDPYFTAYFYEIRDISVKAQPLNAVILSGKMGSSTVVVTDTINNTTDTIVQPVIEDLRWGIETMKYYKEGTTLNLLLQSGVLPDCGDAIIIRSNSITGPGQYEH